MYTETRLFRSNSVQWQWFFTIENVRSVIALLAISWDISEEKTSAADDINCNPDTNKTIHNSEPLTPSWDHSLLNRQLLGVQYIFFCSIKYS